MVALAPSCSPPPPFPALRPGTVSEDPCSPMSKGPGSLLPVKVGVQHNKPTYGSSSELGRFSSSFCSTFGATRDPFFYCQNYGRRTYIQLPLSEPHAESSTSGSRICVNAYLSLLSKCQLQSD